MAGVALVLDLLKKNPNLFPTQVLHSCGLFSATVAASAAAASVSAGRPFLTRFLFGDGGISVAFSDAATGLEGDYIRSLHNASHDMFVQKSLKYSSKEYPIELKPLFSAFGLKSLAITSLRSFLIFYLPLLEPRPPTDEDDDLDAPEEGPVDMVIPFKKSVKQIIRETTVVTTRRVLERLVVHYISRRMAWKLLKDVPKSAQRKAARGMPTLVFLYSVSRSTFRGHLLGIVASWLVQITIEVYRCLFRKSDDDREEVDIAEKIQLLGTRVYSATVKCGASLVFASIGGGIGALIRPSTGQWIGCVLGDFAGPFVVELCFEKILHLDI